MESLLFKSFQSEFQFAPDLIARDALRPIGPQDHPFDSPVMWEYPAPHGPAVSGHVAEHQGGVGSRRGVPPPVPRCPPSRQDWENCRGTFTQLYHIEDRPLKAVKELMEQRYGFKATERMYKKKINEWKVRKNYSREEKDAVLRAVERRRQAGKADHEVRIRDRPVKVDRILRHIKSVAKGSGSQSSGGSSMVMDDDGVEVRNPDAECFVDDEYSLPLFQADLLRGLSWTPGPGRPILLRDDLGKAELLCWESAGYFQTALSDPFRGQGILWEYPFSLVERISVATHHANAGRYYDARVSVNDASELLKKALRDQSLKLLPALLKAVYHSCDEKTPFKVSELFHKHAIQLSEALLGVRHPITTVMRMFREVDNKTQVFSAILEGLLDTLLMKADVDAIDEVPVYIFQRRGLSIETLGRHDEAERVFKSALVTQEVIKRLPWLSVEGYGSYMAAKVTFENVLRRSGNDADRVTDPRIKKNAVDVLAGIAILDELLRRGPALEGGLYRPEIMRFEDVRPSISLIPIPPTPPFPPGGMPNIDASHDRADQIHMPSLESMFFSDPLV